MLEKEQILLLVYFISIIVFVITFVVIFFIAFQKRKNNMLIQKFKAEQAFEKELASTKIEIQEQTLKNISWELHDNIGQLLSVVNMQLNMMKTQASDDFKSSIDETKEVVNTTVEEVRTLSKTLNSEVIQKNGLLRTVEIELERIERLKYAQTGFEIKGDYFKIPDTEEIIIFRILQEFLSNSIKCSRANTIKAFFNYHNNNLTIDLEDDGVGFDTTQKTESSGLQNMASRAQMIGAHFSLTSKINEGTKLRLTHLNNTQ